MASEDFIGNPSPWVRDQIRRGLSQNAAEREARLPVDEGGWGFKGRHEAFRTTFQAVREHMQNFPDITSHPWDSPLDHGSFDLWDARGRGKYSHQVTVTQYDPATGISIDIEWTVNADRPLSPSEAEQRAFDEATEGLDYYEHLQRQRILGANLTGAYFRPNARELGGEF